MHDEHTSVVLSHADYQHLLAAQQELTKLLADSEERKATLERIQGEVAELKAHHKDVLAEYGVHLAELSRKHTNQMESARRSTSALLIAIKALTALRNSMMAPNMQPGQSQWPGEVFQALGDADEVIRAYGIPF